MSELSTEVKYAVIIFHDKSRKFINEQQYNGIIGPYTNPDVAKLDIGGALYSKPSISKILAMEEFYDEYPEERIQIEITPPGYQRAESKVDYKAVNDRNIAAAVDMSTDAIKKDLKKFEAIVRKNNHQVDYNTRSYLSALRQELTNRLKKWTLL